MAYHPGAGAPVPPASTGGTAGVVGAAAGTVGTAQVAPVVPWHRKPWVGVAAVAVTIGLIAVAGLAIYGYLGYTLGPAAFLLAAGLAVLPLPIVVGCFWWLDRYEPE